ncbi:ABC-F family ATP-binding cassette domain-containing protein [Nocardiopsis halophila]|uniref:ABC-F family ATP-binding cassette domain-containing protein n=1 Tax=Nocardiopsis halophila TaxID=141692 RepID=UPI00034D0B56|nr:ABC-F family ATP-binding cassette domain-containing protein [Nocardiopsis halophila]
MITLSGVELRAGARALLTDISLTVSPGDRVGLVGRNGAGKTTLMTAMAGASAPAAGEIVRHGPVGFLPQDPRAADQAATVTGRILSARGLDTASAALRDAEAAMAAAADPAALERAMRAYARAEAAFQAAGGHTAEAEAARVAAGLGLEDRLMHRPVGELSGGQRRRVELARILFGGAGGTLLLDEPTNHLDSGAVSWLRAFLRAHQGGLVLITHDTGLLADVANRVFHLDARRSAIDVYNLGWQGYQDQRAAEERRRARERAGAERKAASLHAQADRMKARSATAVAARNMARRADRMLAETEPVRSAEKTARIRLPEPEPCGRVPLGAVGLAKAYDGHQVLKGVDLAVDRGTRMVVLGYNGAGKTTLLRLLTGRDAPDEGRVVHGHGLRIGYFAQEHDTLDPEHTVLAALTAAAPHLAEGEARRVLGGFLFTGDDADKPVPVLSGGEKTRLALAGLVHSGANVLLLDEPTNNLDPASRGEVLSAVGRYPGAIVMVTHDEGAIDALRPERVLLLPDADEDLWSDDHRELVSLV